MKTTRLIGGSDAELGLNCRGKINFSVVTIPGSPSPATSLAHLDPIIISKI